VDYKRELLKLMVVVKLEEIGYRQADLNSLIDLEMASIEDIESVRGSDLDLRATEASLRIIARLFGENNAQIPRFMGESSSRSRRGEMQG
jgi:hypothetical protein